MAEIALVASIIAVFQIHDDVVGRAIKYGKAIKDAKKDMDTLQRDVDDLKLVLTKLKDIVQKAASSGNSFTKWPTLASLQGKDSPIDHCQSSLEDLLLDLSSEGLRDRLMARIAWPHIQKKFKTRLTVINKHKEHFLQCLNLDQAAQTHSAGQTVGNLGHREVVRWLLVADASVNNVAAFEKHDPTTSKWLLEDSRYILWKNTVGEWLWLHGPSGCGKTVLCSVIIQDTTKKVARNRRGLLVYRFFDVNDRAKQTVGNVISSIIGQICAKIPELPICVQKLYGLYQPGHPPRQALADTLMSLLAILNQVHLLIDAFDECTEMLELFAVLKQIKANQSCGARLFLTSQDQRYIKTSLVNLVGHYIDVTGSGHDLDIKSYISECLSANGKLGRWADEQVKTDLARKLLDGAQGSYEHSNLHSWTRGLTTC